jgi:SAM-dependent methyltransferase
MPDGAAHDWKRIAFSFDPSFAGLHISSGFTNDELISWTGAHEQTEPEAHIEGVGMRLKEITQLERAKVLTLSGKDLSLGRYLGDWGATVENLLAASTSATKNESAGFPAAVAKLEGQWPAEIEGFDCVVARHVFEHLSNLKCFLAQTKRALLPEGLLVLEVPDVANQLDHKDPTLLWDEHRHYFTKRSLLSAFNQSGWHVLEVHQVTSDAEHLVWVIARPRGISMHAELAEPGELQEERSRVDEYFRFINQAKQRLRRLAARSSLKSAVILGANHATAMFLNLVWPEDIPIRVIDDHPSKQGKQLSRLRVPIDSLEKVELNDDEIYFCGINRARAGGAVQRLKAKAKNETQVHMLQDLAEVLPS